MTTQQYFVYCKEEFCKIKEKMSADDVQSRRRSLRGVAFIKREEIKVTGLKKWLAGLTAGVMLASGAAVDGAGAWIETLSGVSALTASAGRITVTTGESTATLSYGYLDDGTIAITGCSSATGDLEIPSEINGVAVTGIEEYAFDDCQYLTSITIPDSVIYIESNAFYNCSSLTSITIPDNVTEIKDYVFYRCSSLTSITIPDGVTSIGSAAFNSCTSLTSITIPDSVTSIELGAFLNCDALTDVYYTGSQSQWKAIEIGSIGNACLTNATIHYNTSPAATLTTLATGDLDGDGAITIEDAYSALMAYAKTSAGLDSGLTDVQKEAADVDGNGKLTINDAYKILQYYANTSVGNDVTWDDILAN